MNKEDQKKGNVGATIFLFILAIILLIFSVKQQLNSNKKDKELSNEISQKVSETVKREISDVLDNKEQKNSEYPDYYSLSSLKKLPIVNNFESWTPSSSLVDNKIKKEIIIEKGNLSKGYVYIRSSLNKKALSTWESIYLKMNNNGGHLFRPDSLPIPKSDKTEMLFALDNIAYLSSLPYSENKVALKTNWFNYFKDDKKIEIITFISSLKPALIEEVSLYYDCIDSTNCLLSIK